MTSFIRGQKAKLSDITPATTIEVGLTVQPLAGNSLDVSCFGLDANGKLSDDRYFIFYNQKRSPEGALSTQGGKYGEEEVFQVDLEHLPTTIRRLVFTATLDGAGTMAQIGPSTLKLFAHGQPVGTFAFSGADFGPEKAIMVGELYFKDVWRFAANGQGFAGGLAALLAHFGGEEMKGPAAAPAPPPPAPPKPADSRDHSKVMTRVVSVAKAR